MLQRGDDARMIVPRVMHSVPGKKIENRASIVDMQLDAIAAIVLHIHLEQIEKLRPLGIDMRCIQIGRRRGRHRLHDTTLGRSRYSAGSCGLSLEAMGLDPTPRVSGTAGDSAASSDVEMSEDLKSRVIKVIAKTQRIPLETVSIDSTFEELKIDSLDGINLIFALESEFNVDIPDEDARAIRSVRQMAQGIAHLMAQKSAEQGAA